MPWSVWRCLAIGKVNQRDFRSRAVAGYLRRRSWFGNNTVSLWKSTDLFRGSLMVQYVQAILCGELGRVMLLHCTSVVTPICCVSPMQPACAIHTLPLEWEKLVYATTPDSHAFFCSMLQYFWPRNQAHHDGWMTIHWYARIPIAAIISQKWHKTNSRLSFESNRWKLLF
jgi:hypothetical protein